MNEETRSLFNRQRRNLMGMSVIVLFVSFSGLEFKKLNVLGNELDVSNPHVVYLALWIALGYWLIRYFQFLHELEYVDAYRIYEQTLFAITINDAEEIFSNNLKKNYQNVNFQSEPHGKNWDVMPSAFNPFFKRKFGFACTVKIMRNDGTGYSENFESHLSLNQGLRKDFIKWWKALNYTVWRTSSVSEYIFPPLLALGVALACVVRYLITRA